MKSIDRKGAPSSTAFRNALVAGASALTIGVFACAYAQPVDEVPDAEDEAAASDDKIVVTGSRLRKDTFSSASPLQSLDTEAGRKIGVSSIQELLTRSVVSNGQQIDQTLNTNAGNSNATEAPPAGGTGSSNISLRGLGPERTLVLLNGRRLASTGVRGAPSQPDISLIPFSMVDRAEIVTEAGSSIYGADAVAGTVNIILKKDFEGFELNANVEVPEHTGGTQWQVGFLAGAQGDNARIIFGAEYFDRQRVLAGDRDYSSSFRDIRVDEAGNTYIIDRDGFFDNVALVFPNGIYAPDGQPGAPVGSPPGFNDNRFFLTPGATDIGIPNWSTSDGLPAVPAGLRDFCDQQGTGSQTGVPQCRGNFPYFDFYNDQDERRASDLVGDLERLSVMTTGEVDLDWFGTNNQFYFEAFYFNRQTFAIGTVEQIFPDVPGFVKQVDDAGNFLVDGMGQPLYFDNPLNPFVTDFVPIITVGDIPQTRDVELQQFRFVGGMRGEFPSGWLAENDWQWDTYFSYDRGTGHAAQPILFEPHLIQATLGVYLDPDGNPVCDVINQTNQVGGFVTPPTCVPIDFTRLDLYTGGADGEGRFSDAERGYLVGNRTNRTAIEQYVASAFVDGELFDSPWGDTISAGIGFEYRKDSIDSQNDIVGVQGLNAAENPLLEGETRGSRHFIEFFGEVNIPLITDRPGIELLNIDGAVRYTDESNFGSDVTYRGRLQYHPVDWLRFSGGYGTSFRAPNLREQFLADQGGGVSGGLDPCIANNIATSLANVGGNEADPTFVNLVSNCIATGVMFTDSNMNGLPDTNVLGTAGVTTIPTTSGGNSALEPETSRTYTMTLAMSQPWFEGFDFDLAVSYYNTKITNTVSEPTADIIVANCFNDITFANGTSPFCSLISRPNTGNQVSNIINNIDVSFFNIGEVTAKGIDVTTRFGVDLMNMGDDVLSWQFTSALSYQLEREIETFDPADRDDNLHEIGTPQTRLNLGSVFNWGDFSLVSEHRRIGKGDQDGNTAFVAHPLLPGPGTFPTPGNSTVLVHVVDNVPAVWYHDAALSYTQDSYTLSIGVNNLLDKDPPLIHNSAGPNRNNAVSSSGYDFFGRTFFISGRVNF